LPGKWLPPLRERVATVLPEDGEMPVTKVAYWQTIALQGTVWRLVIACAKDNIEK